MLFIAGVAVGSLFGFVAGMFTARRFFRGCDCQYKAWVDAFKLRDSETARLIREDRKKYPPELFDKGRK